MCGRYSLADLDGRFARRFNVSNFMGHEPARFNIAPSQLLPVIVQDEKHPEQNRAELMAWGLVPAWSRALFPGFINAKAETLSEKASFKRAFRFQRCLVPASSFFEWKKASQGKVPYLIKLQGQDFFAFAGLYDTWRDPRGLEISSFTI